MFRMDLLSAVDALKLMFELPNVGSSERTGGRRRSGRQCGDGAQDETIVEHLNRTDKSAPLGSSFAPVHG